MIPPAILLIGDPRLRRPARPVGHADLARALDCGGEAIQALVAFRETFGWGRALSAPQLGYGLRLVAFDFGQGPFLAFNPEITWRSRETAIIFDDCLSLPQIVAPVERHVSVTLSYHDARSERHVRERLPPDLAELAQHELDHLDGVLFVDRIVDPAAIIARHHRPRAPLQDRDIGERDRPLRPRRRQGVSE